jgi:hypothetical protein
MIAVVVPVMARICQTGRQGHRGEEGGGNQKPYVRHLDSPEVSLKIRHFWPVWELFFRQIARKMHENRPHRANFWLQGMLNEIPTQSGQGSAVWSGP